MKWRHLNKPRPPSKGYKMSSLVVGAWHSWQQLCQIEEQVLWPGRQPNPSRKTSLRPTLSPSFSPAKFISKCKAASKWRLLLPALQNGKALQFYFIRTNKFKREEKYFSGLVLASGTLLGLLSVSRWGEKGSRFMTMPVSWAVIARAFSTLLPITPTHHCPKTYYPLPQSSSMSSLHWAKKTLLLVLPLHLEYTNHSEICTCAHTEY